MVLRHELWPRGCAAARLLAAAACLLWLELPGGPLCVLAEEEASPPETDPPASPPETDAPASSSDDEVEDAAPHIPDEPEEEAPSTDENAPVDAQSGEQFMDSARELQEKLGQLKALLDAKGDDADPQLKERLAGLEDQLKGLGLDGLTGGGVGSNKELTDFLSGCVALAMRRVGVQRPSTIGSLRRLASRGFTTKQAASSDFFRMIAICVGDFTEEQYSDYKEGKLKVLPKSMVEEAKKPEAAKKVLDIDAEVWAELQQIAGALVQQLAPGSEEKPQTWYGWLAAVPLLGIFGFLGVKFREMQKREEAKKEKASKKKSK